MNRKNLRQGQTVYLVIMDVEHPRGEWLVLKFFMHSDKTPLPEEYIMIEKMPRSHFRDAVMRFVPPGRLFYSRKKAQRKCNMMNGVYQ